MAPNDDQNGSYIFAKRMMEKLEQDRIDKLLHGAKPDGSPFTTHEAFTAGYTVGCYDTYDGIAKRMSNMVSTLKAVYDKLTAASQKYDDVETLRDLNEMVGILAGYLVEESEETMSATLNKLARQSGVPIDYINGTVGYGSIPRSAFIEIAKRMCTANSNQWAVFAVSGGYIGPDDTLLTFEELKEGVASGKYTAVVPQEEALLDLLEKYGARQVRVVRKMYRDLEISCATFRAQHEKSASAVAGDFLARLQNQK